MSMTPRRHYISCAGLCWPDQSILWLVVMWMCMQAAMSSQLWQLIYRPTLLCLSLLTHPFNSKMANLSARC